MNEQITAEHFRSQNLTFRPVLFEHNEQLRAALAAGRSSLPDPNTWVILPQLFSRQPYTAVIRCGDQGGFSFALSELEETGITAANADEMRRTREDGTWRRPLGALPEVGQALRLDPTRALSAIKAAGNDGELHARHLRLATRLAMPRISDELWTRGGLHHSPPFR